MLILNSEDDSMLCGLIMAGGKGTRFWPLSTDDRPKQFLSLISERTMIQTTVDRILPIIPIERIFVCTSKKYFDLVKEQLPELPERNIIVEPEGRNTAPCIALSAMVMKRYYDNCQMLVLPSDHLIRDNKVFLQIINDASKFIDNNDDAIITLGMNPNRPETGYGYIKKESKLIKINNSNLYKVESFVEKPNLEKALEYLNEGSYLWNGGIFLWNVNSILNKIKLHMPDTYNALDGVLQVSDDKLEGYLNEKYKYTDSISIDYGILEKDNNIYVIPANIGWDDVGSWNAIERYAERDEDNNIHKGETIARQCKNNIVITDSDKVIIDDLSDIYVIQNEGNIFIGKRKNLNEIKELKELIDK